jgi:CRP/FNR family cyclic AMP-dependent transcriptional regulator
MTMSSVARSAWVSPGTMANDTLSELDARKRRIIRRGAIGNAASHASLAALMEAGTISRVEKGHVLVTQGEQASQVVLIGMGRVRLTRAMGDGRSLALGYRGAGDLLGEAGLGGVSAHRESAVATEDVEALLVPLPVLRAIVGADQPFATALLTMMVERHHDTEERLTSMLFRNVEARLAEFLLKSSARWGVPEPRGVLIAAPFTHQEMANMIGSTRETVTLTLGDLRRKGVIEIDRRRIVVLDKEALKARV